MTLVRNILVAALVLVLAAATASARPLTEAEKRLLADRIEAFDAAMRSGDYDTVVNVVPPRVLNHIAEKADLNLDALRGIVVEQMEAALSAVKIESFDMDLSRAEHRELPAGDPYVLVPTETVIDGGGRGKVRAKSHTLAMLDDGVWYLLRVEDVQQLLVLRQVYPDFEGVEFPSGTMEALK